MFKFKKYKDRYTDEKSEASLRDSLEMGSFFRSEGQDPSRNSIVPATIVETSLNALSNNGAPLATSFLSTTPDVGRVAGALPTIVEENSLMLH